MVEHIDAPRLQNKWHSTDFLSIQIHSCAHVWITCVGQYIQNLYASTDPHKAGPEQ